MNCVFKILCALVVIASGLNHAATSEKFTPAGIEQGPEIFEQLAKESIIYISGLKFTQEAQT